MIFFMAKEALDRLAKEVMERCENNRDKIEQLAREVQPCPGNERPSTLIL